MNLVGSAMTRQRRSGGHAHREYGKCGTGGEEHERSDARVRDGGGVNEPVHGDGQAGASGSEQGRH
jgi:hypothetical protein